jgi:rubrerythrin
MEQTYLSDTESFLRKSISEEQLAISVYLDRKTVAERYASDCRNSGNLELANKFDIIAHTLEDILQEEEVHVGQLREMLDLINVSKDKEQEGTIEAEEDIEKLESFVAVAKRISRYIED